MQGNTLPLQTVPASPHDLSNALIERIRKGNMRDGTPLEERPRPEPLRPIDDLVRDHEIARFDVLLQASDGGEGDDSPHADRAQGGNIGTGRNLVRRKLMV